MTLKDGGYRERIDNRVAPLVCVMSTLPGIRTYTSCGGHKKVTHPSQSRENEFSVGFIVEPNNIGFFSLGLITLAVSRVDEENIMIRSYNIDESPEKMVFHVDGFNCASPCDLMNEIQDCLKKYQSRIDELKKAIEI